MLMLHANDVFIAWMVSVLFITKLSVDVDFLQAYLWGFDIRNWKNHLNPLTWPEILRQFALSAAFGPQLKKKSIKMEGFPDNDEVLFFL